MIDDSLAEREGLHQTWPSSNIFMCTFHFLRSMWRWLLCSKNYSDYSGQSHDLEAIFIERRAQNGLASNYKVRKVYIR